MMNRRTFIETTGIITAGAITPLIHIPMTKKVNYKMGYQLYSIRDAMATAPIETIKALIDMGYKHFEGYGYDEVNTSYYGYKASELKSILDDVDVAMTSCHYGFAPLLDKSDDELARYVDQCIIGAQTLDSPYITWPWIAPEQRTTNNFKKMARKLNLIGEQVNAAGLGFSYHNHGYEFDMYDGEMGLDIIINETDAALVKLQMDMYWVMHAAKTTPKQLIADQPGRYVMWHIKDMDKVSRDYTELGNGSINYKDILPDPEASGLEYYYIEQGGNYTHNSTQSAKDSALFLQQHLTEYL